MDRDMDTDIEIVAANEAPDPFARMQAFMEKSFEKTNSNIAEINRSVTKINEKTEVNARNLNRLKETIKSNSEKAAEDACSLRKEIERRDEERTRDISKLQEVVREMQKGGPVPHTPSPTTTATYASVAAAHQPPSNARVDAYWLARRQVRIWPITGTTAELKENSGAFFYEVMEIPPSVLPESKVVEIERVPSMRHRPEHDEILITFSDIAIRDIVSSYARNLAPRRTETGKPTAGLRMVVPDHLTGIQRALDRHGHRLKKLHGPGLRRNLKFDDTDCTLFLDVCLPGENDWMRVDFEEALIGRKQELQREASSTRSRLTSSASEDDGNTGS